MKKIFENDWQEILADEFEKPYYQQLRKFVAQEYSTTTVYPSKEEVMNAFYVSYQDVKVVILGQDPYHGPGQAHGMCFSVKPGVPHPPSLRNIFQELQSDIGCPIPKDGYLMKWAKQGVFLLNTVLTVRQGEANSHKGMGWEQFTDAVIEKLAKRQDPIIFVLWGRPAQSKQSIIRQSGAHHVILQAPHPSPLSAHRGFFGSKPFSKINEQLEAWGKQPIDWCIE
ncbi:uracil-DNA glycosylase [Ureibacillus massiliensis 4400831 = CIP 108448 = CCUG 49529]|uniref:Uracil-DNA glycosylase n=1 Tax=Ureibacillus massiliensis 4400831 = CIP 108448 = CCUG 49529 TaxID=1211035 RepID=A0A0A3JZL6_9BACL|nr:uracil-DNA glycosylase [Ureibacillus massiliensis]KGR92422.1 uracil-DNA glycosylase [Ureibacillus massiliensis 4400831 = CIP 108448 = CCUG 49529]